MAGRSCGRHRMLLGLLAAGMVMAVMGKTCTNTDLVDAVVCYTKECGSLYKKSSDWCDNAIDGNPAGGCCLCDNINSVDGICCCELNSASVAALTIGVMILFGGGFGYMYKRYKQRAV